MHMICKEKEHDCAVKKQERMAMNKTELAAFKKIRFCEPIAEKISGYFYGGNPLDSTLPRFLFQITSINVFTLFFQFILMPFDQPTFVCQMLGSMAFGQLLLGENDFTRKFFQVKGIIVIIVFELLGIMLFYFMVGMKVDMGVIKHSGKIAIIIGITSFIAPLLTTGVSSWFMISRIPMKEGLRISLPAISSIESQTTFHVMSVVLTDLKLLNSELGRIAMSSSLVSDLLGLTNTILAFYMAESSDEETRKQMLPTNASRLFLILVIVFLFRPIMSWITRSTPEGKPLKEPHFFLIFIMIFMCAFYGELTGLEFLFGPLLFGLFVPTGPPIATSLLDKLGYLVSVVLIPCYIVHLSLRFKMIHLGMESLLIVLYLIIVATITKLVAVVVTCIYFKVPLVDAVALGLLMNCKGLFNIQTYDRATFYKHISEESCKVMMIMALLRTAIFTPIVRALYDPSKRYIAYKRHTIQHSKPNAEIRFIACVHTQTDVPSLASLMEITNPTRENPIGLYVLHLVELKGRSASLFITHKLNTAPPSKKRKGIDQIMKAFAKLELQTLGNMVVQYFTAISPYATIHDDICTLALDKSASFVILPFHRSDTLAMRTINKNVLEKAPCSVGILIIPISLQFSCFNVCLFFIHGPDDREALAYAARMVEHEAVKLSVIRICSTKEGGNNNLIEKKLDTQAISDIKMKADANPRIEYKDENVKDVAGTTLVIGSLKKGFDIIIVGRGHDEDSPVLKGISEWCEFKELGVIGDLLVATDYNKGNASILVVQQQASVVEKMLQV